MTRVRYAQLADPAWLCEQYVVRGRSSVDISKELGCLPRVVRKALERAGILRRAVGARPVNRERRTRREVEQAAKRAELEEMVAAGRLTIRFATSPEECAKYGIKATALMAEDGDRA